MARRRRIDERFPFADGESLGQAPARCDRCGGVWRLVDEGYGCSTCPRRWRAAAVLRSMMSRPAFHANNYPGRASHQAQPKRRP
jgi:hypothetical protein